MEEEQLLPVYDGMFGITHMSPFFLSAADLYSIEFTRVHKAS